MATRLDPNRTWLPVVDRLERERDPRRRRNLQLVLDHMRAEAAADIDGVLATLNSNPRYVSHRHPASPVLNVSGRDGVRAYYDATIVSTGAHRLEYTVARVLVDDDAVFTEGTLRMAYPGRTLLGMGIAVDDPEAYYLSEGWMGIMWPVDDAEGRLVGEESYSATDPFEGIAERRIELDEIAELVPVGA